MPVSWRLLWRDWIDSEKALEEVVRNVLWQRSRFHYLYGLAEMQMSASILFIYPKDALCLKYRTPIPFYITSRSSGNLFASSP